MNKLFLLSALALSPSLSFQGPTHADTLQLVLKTDDFLSFRMLLVDGDPHKTLALRDVGVQAFGAFTTDWPYISKWHTVTGSGALAFKESVFLFVAWYHPNIPSAPHFDWLNDVVTKVAPFGYLAFDDVSYEAWVPLLSLWGWRRIPSRYDGLAIYQNTRRSS